MAFLKTGHSRFQYVQRDVFFRRIVADCMSHSCQEITGHKPRLDACCQYGVDVDLRERDGILEHAKSIQKRLLPTAAHAAWFGSNAEPDPDFPSGAFVRTQTMNGGCIFLAHDKRGCAIHRTAAEEGWDFRGVKPHVCRLFPLSYTDDTIVISDDYKDYSCAYDPLAPTLYHHTRDLLLELFGQDLVDCLDAVEQTAQRHTIAQFAAAV